MSAAGDPLFAAAPNASHGPATDSAIVDFTAAPDPCLDFDDGTDETIFFRMWMQSNYDGTSDIDVVLDWKFTTFVGSQTIGWKVAFYRIADDADSVESYSFAAEQVSGAVAEASATGEIKKTTITFTNAQANGVQGAEWFILRVVRNAAIGTASPGDGELSGVAGVAA